MMMIRPPLVVAALSVLLLAAAPAAAGVLDGIAKETEESIVACWNDTAAPLADGADRESEGIRETVTMSVGNPCRLGMSDALLECLKAAAGDEYRCVGKVSAICLGARKWAKNDMRNAACIEAEQMAWVTRYQEAAGLLKDKLSDEGRSLMTDAEEAQRQHSGYACELFRNAFGSDRRVAAWHDCRMQAAARLAIDFRDLARTAGAMPPVAETQTDQESQQQTGGEDGAAAPQSAVGPAQPSTGRPAAERWGALAFTAAGGYGSAWRYATKAEAEAAVLKSCTKLDEGRCEVISFEGRYCAALASYRVSGKRKILRGAYTGAGESVPAAQKSALDRCKEAMGKRGGRGDCTLRTVVCGDGR